ncbi:MAG: hypothetical protein WKF37_09815 [Bryobacteraceae bacterium]
MRQPSQLGYDMSLMKAFYFTEEHGSFLQLRVEGRNILNLRGYGNYNTTIGTNDFGLITSAGPNGPRTMQVSARIVF